ncbi:MAG: TetR/AcrR family transcriptional regulator [Chloroflexota bacterium]
MPRTAKQNQAIREEAKGKLIESAMTIFANQGFANASIRKIAAEAGVSLGLLYHYFASKDELLQAVFEHCMERLGQGFSGVYEIEEPLAQVGYLLDQIFFELRTDPLFWGLFASLRSQPAVMPILGESLKHWTGHLRELFQHSFDRVGRPEPEVDAYLIYSLVEGAIQQYLLDPENYPLDAVIRRIKLQFEIQ